MPAPSPLRRARWIGAGCALAVLAIWTSFILVSAGTKLHENSRFEVACFRSSSSSSGHRPRRVFFSLLQAFQGLTAASSRTRHRRAAQKTCIFKPAKNQHVRAGAHIILIARFSAGGSLTPFDIAFARFCFSGLIALPIAVWRWRSWRDGLGGEQALRRGGVLAGVAGVAYCGLAYSGFWFAPAAHAAVLMPGSLPLWTALFAVLLLGERLSATRLAGLTLIVAGDLLVGGSSLLQALQGGLSWKGDLLFLAAGMTWALYGVLCRRWRIGAVDATLAIAVGSLLSYVPLFALLAGSGWLPSGLGSAPWREIAFQAVYQGGFAMLLAGLAFTQVVVTFGPVRTTMMTALVPVLAALSAVPLLGEPLSTAALGGLACVTCGLLLGLHSGRGAPRLLERAA